MITRYDKLGNIKNFKTLLEYYNYILKDKNIKKNIKNVIQDIFKGISKIRRLRNEWIN